MKKHHAMSYDKPLRIYASILSFCLLPSAICLLPAQAQITPDNTLGAENSRLTPNVLINNANADQIEGGAQRGSNLFHSFTQFNVGNRQRVYFGNPDGVQNILTRVTGGQSSNILGTLGVNGNANLFLINPNGILFGQNARLDIRGAFTATTANSLIFPNGVEFSATNPQAAPLLTINVPIGLQFGSQAGSITNQAANALYVGSGSTLAFVGGEIALDGSYLVTENGQVKLGAVEGNTTVGLNINGSSLDFKLPENVGRAPINFTNARIAATGENSGIELFGGKIALNGNSSYLYSLNGGSIIVDATQLNLDNSAGILSVTTGANKGGDIQIQASDALTLTNSSFISSSSNTPASVLPGNTNKVGAGDITIETQRVNLKDGGNISTNTSSQANAGNILIQASESVEISGISPFSVILSGVFSATSRGATGNGGNVTIETPRLFLTQGGKIETTSAKSSGHAGNITIRAQDIELDGFVFIPKEKLNPLNNPDTEELLSRPLTQEILSRFGGINYTSNLTSDVNQSNADVRGGTIAIDTERLRLSNGGNISASVLYGQGQGGNLVVRATDSIDITGVGAELLNGSFAPSGLFADLQTGGIGSGGSIEVTTGRLNLSNNAEISAGTFNQGNGGDIGINAEQIDLRGSSKITTQVNGAAKGNAGNLSIKTQLLNVQEESQISSATFGNGNGGNLKVKADSIILTGSDSEFATGLLSSVDERANGKGGDIDITTNNLDIRDNAQISSGSIGTGDAGDIRINANYLEIFGKGSAIASLTNVGNGGDITLDIGDLLLLRRGGLISTTAGRSQAGGDGGNISINSPFIVAVPNENSDIRANAFSGKGGNVNINVQNIFGIEPRPKDTNLSDITASSDLGVQGQITITQPQVQPPQKLIELPTAFVDASTKFAQICPRGRNAKPLGSFVVTGRGSLPPNSFEPLAGNTSLSPLASLDGENADTKLQKIVETDTGNSAPIVEAQGLVKTADGNIMLVAEAPTATPTATSSSAMCPAS
jgi:filamentous hemagglutinin family protein